MKTAFARDGRCSPPPKQGRGDGPPPVNAKSGEMTKTMTNKRAQVSSIGRFRDTRGNVKSPIAGKDG